MRTTQLSQSKVTRRSCQHDPLLLPVSKCRPTRAQYSPIAGRDALSLHATMAAMKEHWSKGAEAYAAFSDISGLGPLHGKVLDLVKTGTSKQGQFLDIACGDGEPACSLARMYPEAQVVATDYAPGMVEYASKRAEAMGLKNIRFAVADAMDLSDFPDASFDLVTCVAALLMLPDYNIALQGFHRVLKPGGLMIVTTWGKPEEVNMANSVQIAKRRIAPALAQPPKRAPNVDPSRLAVPEVLREIVGAAGFHDVNAERFNLDFKVPKEALAYPNGVMLAHPFITIVASQLEEAGISHPVKALTEELENIYSENGYSDGSETLRFPTNLANIVSGRA